MKKCGASVNIYFMNWINFTSVDELPKDKIILVANEATIDYIIFDMGQWRYCYIESMIPHNQLNSYTKYLIPTL